MIWYAISYNLFKKKPFYLPFKSGYYVEFFKRSLKLVTTSELFFFLFFFNIKGVKMGFFHLTDVLGYFQRCWFGNLSTVE